jgi:Bifunctional DNA primase/polymerase, N-terminal
VSARPCGHRWDIPLGDAALQYARMGYAVLPLEAGGKKPHGRLLGEAGGVHKATLSTWYIQMWWHAFPDANIGIATGDVSQLLVVDLDTKREDGVSAFRAFLGDGETGFGWDATARTPSGGWHAWLRLHQLMHAARERPGILPGVDIKGNGGYVVAAPSVLSVPDGADGIMNLAYSWPGWACACCAPLAPQWMADWISYAPTTGAAKLASGDLPDVEEAKQHGFAAGERNVSFYLMDCRMYGAGGISAETDTLVVHANRAVWEKTPQQGMTWNEVERCRRSARSFIERNRMAELSIAAALADWEVQAVGMTKLAKRGRARGW